MRPQSCTVGEPLALVLRIMRVLSLAPLTIARERVGYRIRVYKRYAYAGYFFMILINVFHIMCKWFEINLNKKYYTEICTQIPLLIFVRLLNISVVAIITLHGSLFSASRMKNVIEQMFYMEKVIPANKDRERSNKSKIRIIFIFTCKFVIDGMNFFHYVFNMRYPDVIVIGLVLTCFKYAVVRLLRIYLFIIYEAILTKIRIVREELQDLADLLEFGFVSTSAFTQSANMSLQKIGEKLDFIKEIFTKMNQCNEYIAFFMYICMVSWIIHTAFDFIYFRPQDLQEVIFLDILNVMHITLMMMLTIEPFRGIDLEMQAMKLQVGRIATTDYVTDSIPAPLEMLYDELSTMDMTFSPLGVFTMNRSLLVKTLGAAITYLLMVLQFRVN